ncbi:CitB family two-component system response regulator CitT [Scopulibacillus darangshiensis]|uniref:Transcriptional regulatory protein n=1 Tax=Scopulibacillus darangshiensis TaxID=442528 RepID=A0A4R2NPB3_9BACL|nr:response regulator [Scopulibacillus darangshiensis]TCP23482.1 CitB family two-component system response regulator CitT [Scopulibacillus darangshiensis]
METIKVAIAEDDFRVALIHEKFLKKIPDVEVAGRALNAEQTFALLQSQEIDLLLLDIYMPDRLGTEILSSVRRDFPQVDVVMITAATDKAFLDMAIRYGVQNYLIKPVTMERFTEMIHQYIETRVLFQTQEEINQEFVDRLFGKLHQVSPPAHSELPKGIDEITLQKVLAVLKKSNGGLSAEMVGQRMGASRTTARRYLEYLISIERCKAEVEYGIVGRPERKYYGL